LPSWDERTALYAAGAASGRFPGIWGLVEAWMAELWRVGKEVEGLTMVDRRLHGLSEGSGKVEVTGTA
jgi:hypothetical protein